jgi:glyoxylase-like metal-dependent hydrolase (beta-lactamase superfamily II)
MPAGIDVATYTSELSWHESNEPAHRVRAIRSRPTPHQGSVLPVSKETIISDGPLRLGTFSPEAFRGLTQEQIDEVLGANFLDKNNFVVEQNALVVNTGEKLVLIDTGIGFRQIYGPRSGRLLANLRAAGIDPAWIDVVAVSHGHPDHVWGLAGQDGKPNFPNAQIHITQADFDYWTDAAKLSHPTLGAAIGPIRDTLLPLRDRMVFLTDGQDVVPGVQALSTPGHTVGHTSFVINSQGRSLLNIADLGHQPDGEPAR